MEEFFLYFPKCLKFNIKFSSSFILARSLLSLTSFTFMRNLLIGLDMQGSAASGKMSVVAD